MKLKKNKKGYPILPSVEEIDGLTLIDKKKLIGRFMGDVYGVLASCRSLLLIHSLSLFSDISIGTPKGRVPWKKLERVPDDYIEPKYLLEKVVILQQYYHPCLEDVNSMLKYWAERQATNKVPLCFIKAAKPV